MKGGKVRSPGEKVKESETEEGRVRKKGKCTLLSLTYTVFHNGLQSHCY